MFEEMPRRRLIAVLLLLLLLLLVSCCRAAARETQVFKAKAPLGRRGAGFFMGFLPKAVPIPPSAPSKQHNSVGTERRIAP
ncbi:hypothetical protein Cni_G20644 [Canna indica]|uniref:Uncharacterized protein n=1 Tax=Canna indica TaxID=4628 RepID=A0AAQ3QKY5_9LILI|nr:hypothetical protein Cni_G20644 [Canna indica]